MLHEVSPLAPSFQSLRRSRFHRLDTFVAALDTYVRVLLPSGSNFFRTPRICLEVSAVSE
jgi:hypothetical protein